MTRVAEATANARPAATSGWPQRTLSAACPDGPRADQGVFRHSAARMRDTVPMVTVRAASVEDAPVIARVHVAAWRAAYRHLLPHEYLDQLDEDRRAEVWARLLGSEGERSRTYVTEMDDGIIGFANAAPSRDPDADASTTGEIPAIYVHPDSWGAGAGRALIRADRGWLVQAGFHSATLWVLADNVRARKFYEADGWRHDGTVKHDESRGFPVVEVRYARRLP
jgi:GNAT superfamily N-acetyltransferase